MSAAAVAFTILHPLSDLHAVRLVILYCASAGGDVGIHDCSPYSSLHTEHAASLPTAYAAPVARIALSRLPCLPAGPRYEDVREAPANKRQHRDRSEVLRCHVLKT